MSASRTSSGSGLSACRNFSKRVQRRSQLVSWRWGDEPSLRDLLPVDADGVLLLPELTGAIVATANSRQEDAMHLLDHAEAHRQGGQLLEAVLQCADVVVDLAGFAAGGGRKVGGLVQHELLGCGDGPLDPAGDDRFPPLKWADQQVRVLEVAGGPFEPPEGVVGRTCLRGGLPVGGERRRKRVGDERQSILHRLHEAARAVRQEERGIHGL
jgi:hypothetical protein